MRFSSYDAVIDMFGTIEQVCGPTKLPKKLDISDDRRSVKLYTLGGKPCKKKFDLKRLTYLAQIIIVHNAMSKIAFLN